jgi:hypothetical protein
MLPVRLLALIVALFFSIALVPGLIKVPERVRRDTLESMTITKIPDWPNVRETADQSAGNTSKREQHIADLVAKESPEPSAISAKQAETASVPEIVEEISPKSQLPTPDNVVSVSPPAEPGSGIVAYEAARSDLTGSVEPSAVANHPTERLIALPAIRTTKPTVRKVPRRGPQAKASTTPGGWPSANTVRAGAYAWKPVELPPPNFTNSGY